MSIPTVSWFHRVLPAFGRRLIVVDPGRRFLRVLVVDHGLTRPRVVHFQTITPPPGPLAGPEEMDTELDALVAAAGPHERVLVLPQYRAIAQVVEAPAVSPAENQMALLREARRLSGLEESALTFDARRLRPFGRFQNPAWLTLCKREELDALLARFAGLLEGAPAGMEVPLLAEVTTSGQALFAAAGALGPEALNSVLVDLRANNSVVAIVVNGQGVATNTIPTGALQFQPPEGEAAHVTTDERPLAGGAANAEAGATGLEAYHAALRMWYSEIRLALAEWIEDNPECGLSLATLPVYLSGMGATRPGLLEFLNTLGPLRFVAWEPRVTVGRPWPMADYLVPFGAALLAFQRTPHGASLLPSEERVPQQRRRSLAWLQTANVLLILLVLGLLSFSIWQKRGLIARKEAVAARTRTALETAVAIDLAYRQLIRDYAEVYPILDRQRQTVETLQSLAAMRAARTNDDFWYVLFADAATYATGRTGLQLAATPPVARLAATNPPPPSLREYVVEVCVPHEGEKQRRILSDLVADLKSQGRFRRVDALPPERDRDWLPANVGVSNRVFALAMEIAGNELPGLTPATNAPAGREAGRVPARGDGGATFQP